MRGPLFVLLLVGCGRVAFDPVGEAGAGSGSGSNVLCPMIAQCPDRTSSAHMGSTSIGGSIITNHGLSSSGCSSGAGNPELAVLFDVADDATYTITASPAGSIFLYVQDTCCGGPELACGTNPVVIDRMAGQRFVAVVEGFPSAAVTLQVESN